MLRHNTMSEYYTYGIFVDHVSGPHQDLVFVSDQKLCYSLLYGFEETTEDEETFIKNFTGDYVGFGIQSNIGMSWEQREKLAQKLHQAYARMQDEAPDETQGLVESSRHGGGGLTKKTSSDPGHDVGADWIRKTCIMPFLPSDQIHPTRSDRPAPWPHSRHDRPTGVLMHARTSLSTWPQRPAAACCMTARALAWIDKGKVPTLGITAKAA